MALSHTLFHILSVFLQIQFQFCKFCFFQFQKCEFHKNIGALRQKWRFEIGSGCSWVQFRRIMIGFLFVAAINMGFLNPSPILISIDRPSPSPLTPPNPKYTGSRIRSQIHRHTVPQHPGTPHEGTYSLSASIYRIHSFGDHGASPFIH